MNFTQADLELLAEDIGYELKMTAIVGPMQSSADFVVLGNALLEDELLHVRNLDDFLGATTRQQDDVLATDYLPTWTPTRILTDDECRDANKRLFHLSLQRRHLHVQWDRVGIARRTINAFTAFHQELAKQHPARAAWFENDLAAAKTMLVTPVVLHIQR
jgi:hypothetical protein